MKRNVFIISNMIKNKTEFKKLAQTYKKLAKANTLNSTEELHEATGFGLPKTCPLCIASKECTTCMWSLLSKSENWVSAECMKNEAQETFYLLKRELNKKDIPSTLKTRANLMFKVLRSYDKNRIEFERLTTWYANLAEQRLIHNKIA